MTEQKLAPAPIPKRLQALPDDLLVWRFPRWKWRFLRRCFPGKRLHFVEQETSLPGPAALLLWGSSPVPDLRVPLPVLRMEDGFLRSVGLGAELTRPLSWVLDSRGMYYDARSPSDLEWLLTQHDFSLQDREQAAQLREQILRHGISKYNVGGQNWQRPSQAQRVILVPGQVESDAALAHGSPCLRSNLELLRRVREANPQALLLYKPHPDVVARLRAQGKGEARAREHCDVWLDDVPMERLLEQVDEVHTLTSLTGFEALLRGKTVHCYGQPFYSGWGLTVDHCPLPRRTRRLGLDELVAAALIHYPLYFGPQGLIPAEDAVALLTDWKERSQGRKPWWQEPYRAILRRVIGVR
ncbi:MAG: beta-3-deoxy-D-manno-oct-2-ulosonic acid transferase [Acidithiobacillus sp.]|nr:beta-3-deoxy-D-manno-oct-2-ulosonic acid transferase [Acidithiobacillus sp.]